MFLTTINLNPKKVAPVFEYPFDFIARRTSVYFISSDSQLLTLLRRKDVHKKLYAFALENDHPFVSYWNDSLKWLVFRSVFKREDCLAVDILRVAPLDQAFHARISITFTIDGPVLKQGWWIGFGQSIHRLCVKSGEL